MITEDKEYFFEIYFSLPEEKEGNDDIMFKGYNNFPECILTKQIEAKDEKDENKLLKVFKFQGEIKEKSQVDFEFVYDKKDFKVILKYQKGRIFLYDIDLKQETSDVNYKYKSINQNKIEIHDKMIFFKEALKNENKEDKLEILYSDSIKLYDERPNFQFLIKLFINVYNNKLSKNLIDIYVKKIDSSQQKHNIIIENLEKDIDNINDICKNAEQSIKDFELNKIDFYGLIFCYLNNYNNEKFQEECDKMQKKEKDVLFEVLLKYKSYFKKEMNLDNDFLKQLIEYSTSKTFEEFKENIKYYLKNINIFLEIINNCRDKIIEIKDFKPIDIIKIEDNEIIDFHNLIKNICSILVFSKDQKKLLVNFKCDFWKKLAEKCLIPNIINIKLCYQIQNECLEKYFSYLQEFLNEYVSIQKEIKEFYNKETFKYQLDKLINAYINNNNNVSNTEIVDLIKNYNFFYQKIKMNI